MSEAPFVARVSRGKVLGFALFLLAAAGMAAALAAPHIVPESSDDWIMLPFCAGVMLMFLYGAFRIVRTLSYRGEVIAVDATGIRIPPCYQGSLPWSAIARAAVVKGRLHLWLDKDAALPAGKGLDHVLRTNQALRRGGDSADLVVTTWLADRPNSALIEAVRASAPQLFA